MRYVVIRRMGPDPAGEPDDGSAVDFARSEEISVHVSCARRRESASHEGKREIDSRCQDIVHAQGKVGNSISPFGLRAFANFRAGARSTKWLERAARVRARIYSHLSRIPADASRLATDESYVERIHYSERYQDEAYEFRHVSLRSASPGSFGRRAIAGEAVVDALSLFRRLFCRKDSSNSVSRFASFSTYFALTPSSPSQFPPT